MFTPESSITVKTMIKSLLDADENPPPGTQVIIEDTAINAATGEKITDPALLAQLADSNDLLEIPQLGKEPENASQIFNAASEAEKPPVEANPFAETFTAPTNAESNVNSAEAPLFQTADLTQSTSFQPETTAETIRKSGLAYAAAVTLTASIVFLLIIGWLVDLLLGSSPWGIVVGIVLGSIIGFLQFFRLTSQILKDKD